MGKIKVLFVCVHNSARSQMAEAFLNRLGGERFFAESAGLEPGVLNPNVVEVMKEAGIDISGNKTKSVFEFFKQGKIYNYVVTVCDASAGERCRSFPEGSRASTGNSTIPPVLKGRMKKFRKNTDCPEKDKTKG